MNSDIFIFSSSVCFKIFDSDQDGELSEDEIRAMVSGLLSIQNDDRCNEMNGVDKLKKLADGVENMKGVLNRIAQHTTQKDVHYSV